MRKRTVCLVLAALLALTVCTGAAMACFQPEAAVVSHGHHDEKDHHGGHHGGGSHHGEAEECDWLFRTYGKCNDVNCTKQSHSHRCAEDCASKYHQHYGVCQYEDGTLALTEKKA